MPRLWRKKAIDRFRLIKRELRSAQRSIVGIVRFLLAGQRRLSISLLNVNAWQIASIKKSTHFRSDTGIISDGRSKTLRTKQTARASRVPRALARERTSDMSSMININYRCRPRRCVRLAISRETKSISRANPRECGRAASITRYCYTASPAAITRQYFMYRVYPNYFSCHTYVSCTCVYISSALSWGLSILSNRYCRQYRDDDSNSCKSSNTNPIVFPNREKSMMNYQACKLISYLKKEERKRKENISNICNRREMAGRVCNCDIHSYIGCSSCKGASFSSFFLKDQLEEILSFAL